MTYRELNEQSNRLAARLTELGAGPETIVGIVMRRSLESVVGVLGVLKTGGAYLPLAPTDPPARLRTMVQDSGALAVVTDPAMPSDVLTDAAPLVHIDANQRPDDRESARNPVHRVTADNLAYVTYTSGSTGAPEGVLGRVRSVVIPDEVLSDPHRLVRTLATERVTRIVLVPSLLRALLDAHADLGAQLPDLKMWVTSGDVLTADEGSRFLKQVPHARLINLYGSTEVSADVTCYEMSVETPTTRVPIGRPIANTQAYALDGQREPVPIGVAGELYIGGHGLARGYLQRPELTAETFLPNPFSRAPGARLYRTADRCRWRADGDLELLGRLDTQVKMRGFRIELHEVEMAFDMHPSVRQSVVILREDQPGDQRLVAYYVGSGRREVSVADLTRYLRAQLRAFMIPSAWVALDGFPLTPSGKTDRGLLPAPDASRPSLEALFVAPRNTREERLASI